MKIDKEQKMAIERWTEEIHLRPNMCYHERSEKRELQKVMPERERERNGLNRKENEKR